MDNKSRATITRQAVRAIVLDADNRVLLFKAFADASRSRYFWITPGGGVVDGESHASALRRELAEECGLRDSEIGPLVWEREHVFALPGSGRRIRQRERFYLVRVSELEVDVTGWDSFERDFMGEHRWWTADEVRKSSDTFAPRGLADYLANIIRGEIPTQPLDVGV